MTISLTASIAPGQVYIPVTNGLSAVVGQMYQIDGEYVVVIQARAARLHVVRGMLGSARAEHADEEVLTAVNAVTITSSPVDPPVASAGFLFVRATLSSADILALGTPYELVAAPGLNKILVYNRMWFYFHAGLTPYVQADILQFGITGNEIAIDNGASLTKSVDQLDMVGPDKDANNAVFFVNLPLSISTRGGNPTDGDGTADVFVEYSVLDLAS